MNQIKEARNIKKISQKQLADELNITQQAVSYYEKGDRIPDETTWQKMSVILDVPVEFLKGTITDPVGWELWEEVTGHDVNTIKFEINRMKNANHIIGDANKIQNIIGQAVANLEGIGNTDRGIIMNINSELIKLNNKLDEKYMDPQKTKDFQLNDDPSSLVLPATTPDADLIFDDLSAEAYEQAKDILYRASVDLKNIPYSLDLH